MIVQYIIVFIIFIIFMGVAAYIAFPRQSKNLITAIRHRKRYVIVFVKRTNTDYIEKYNIVPESDKLTKVGEYSYMLDQRYRLFRLFMRDIFYLNELDTVPKTFADMDDSEIIFQAHEIRDALNNDITKNLFSQKKDIMTLIMMALSFFMILVMIYTVSIVSKVSQVINS